VDGRIILKLVQDFGWKIVHLINPAKNKDKWRALVDTETNILVKGGEYIE